MTNSAAPQPTSVHVTDMNGVRVLSVSGPLTISSLFPFQEAWRSETAAAMVFDLTQVPYADSAAIGSIVNAYVSCQNSGRRMAVAAGDRVHKVMEITNVATLFPLFSTLHEAITAMKSVGQQ